jgi:hypothetical protein
MSRPRVRSAHKGGEAAAEGCVVEDRRGPATIFALRFRAPGGCQYVSLGTEREGWTRELAEQERQPTLSEVANGTWTHPRERRGGS